jgi:SAM-dependent methyltransferase
MNEYWDRRYRYEGKIWGELPSRTALEALDVFRRYNVRTVLVPGSGYGRNTRLFSESGLNVTGIEISATAHAMAVVFDPLSQYHNVSVLDMSFLKDSFDAVYCFNVLHLFRERDRGLFIQQCIQRVREKGILYFTVFSEEEESYGKGNEVEKDTFESRPGRPVHYFTIDDLKNHFNNAEIVDTGIIEDPEDHGEGPHIHKLRYICVIK